MALYAELHRHLGGSVVPRVLWRYFQRYDAELSERFPDYEPFEEFYTRPRETLDEYLELHTLVETVQTAKALPYFIFRLLRGAYVFENLAYLELRYTPYYRTDSTLPQNQRIDQMCQIVEVVGQAMRVTEYPIITQQILCTHIRLPWDVNAAIVELARDYPQYVCAIDIAGGDNHYGDRLDELVKLFGQARSHGVKTTGHLYETAQGCHPQLLPYLMRIGHGIQIPLQFPELLREVAANGQCLEICPTTYFKTGTLDNLDQLRTVFNLCFDAGVDVAIGTDNAGLHNVRLPFEYEDLLTHDILNFRQLQACQDAAFRHAFAWPHRQPPTMLLKSLLQEEPPEAESIYP